MWSVTTVDISHTIKFALELFVPERDTVRPFSLGNLRNELWTMECDHWPQYMRVMKSNLPCGFSFPKGTQCVPFHMETLEMNFDPRNVIIDHSRCESCNQIFPGAFRSRKGHCVPFHRETLDLNFDPWNVTSDHSRCESYNQICPGAFRSRKGHCASLFTGKP